VNRTGLSIDAVHSKALRKRLTQWCHLVVGSWEVNLEALVASSGLDHGFAPGPQGPRLTWERDMSDVDRSMPAADTSERKPRILVFAGSIRAESFHRKLARAATAALESAAVEVSCADLGDYPMPLYDADLERQEGLPDTVLRFKKLVWDHEGFLIASPEYNGSFSARIKNIIDWISRPEKGEKDLAIFEGKIAGLVSASPGPRGGARGLQHLREVLEVVGVTVIPAQVTIRSAFEAFDAGGNLARSEDAAAMESLANGWSSAARAQMKSTAARNGQVSQAPVSIR